MGAKKVVDASAIVIYHRGNTGKEVINKKYEFLSQ